MENFWVAEESEGIGEAVRRQLGERDRRTVAGGSPWLLVVSPRAAERRRQLPTGCRTVLLPGGAGGLLSGLAYFLVLFVVSWVMNKGGAMDMQRSLTVMGICAVGGTLGGMLS